MVIGGQADCVYQDLRLARRQILGVVCSSSVGGLAHQGAVAVIGVGAGLPGGRAGQIIRRLIPVTGGVVAGQVPALL